MNGTFPRASKIYRSDALPKKGVPSPYSQVTDAEQESEPATRASAALPKIYVPRGAPELDFPAKSSAINNSADDPGLANTAAAALPKLYVPRGAPELDLPGTSPAIDNGVDDPIKHVQGKEILAKRLEKAQEQYYLKGHPRDYRFAHEVHGASFSSPWKWFWTEDDTVSIDAHANHLQNEMKDVFNKQLLSLYRNKLNHAVNDPKTTPEDLLAIRQKMNDLASRKPRKARLSDLVLRLEVVAVTYMRNLVDSQLRRKRPIGTRNTSNHYNLASVRDQLEPARYNYDLRLLSRSIRRDDLAFQVFAGLVGTLALEAIGANGVFAMAILPTRMQNRRIGHALGEAVAFIAQMPRMIIVDEIGDNEEVADDHGNLMFLNHAMGTAVYTTPDIIPEDDSITVHRSAFAEPGSNKVQDTERRIVEAAANRVKRSRKNQNDFTRVVEEVQQQRDQSERSSDLLNIASILAGEAGGSGARVTQRSRSRQYRSGNNASSNNDPERRLYSTPERLMPL